MRMFLASICVPSIASSNHLSDQCRPPNSRTKTARWRKGSSRSPSSFLLTRSMMPLPLVPADQEQRRREDVFRGIFRRTTSQILKCNSAVAPPFSMLLPPKIPLPSAAVPLYTSATYSPPCPYQQSTSPVKASVGQWLRGNVKDPPHSHQQSQRRFTSDSGQT